MNFRDSAARFVATGCYVGHVPFAPGSFGAVLGLPLCFLMSVIEWPHAVLFVICFTVFAIWAAHRTEKVLDKKDPGCIVVDEMVGMVVTMIGLPFTIKSAVIGYIVFRFFDIVKPPPIRYVDKKLPGGAGVVLDDVVAGIMGNAALRFVFHVTGY